MWGGRESHLALSYAATMVASVGINEGPIATRKDQLIFQHLHVRDLSCPTKPFTSLPRLLNVMVAS